MINQEEQRRKIFFEYFFKTLCTIFALFSLGLFSTFFFIFSEFFCYIPAIIKNVYIAAKIHIFDLNIITHTNQKAGTPVILQCISQFPIDCWPKCKKLADVNQIIINE